MRLPISNSAALDARQCRDERALTKSAILVALGGIRVSGKDLPSLLQTTADGANETKFQS